MRRAPRLPTPGIGPPPSGVALQPAVGVAMDDAAAMEREWMGRHGGGGHVEDGRRGARHEKEQQHRHHSALVTFPSFSA